MREACMTSLVFEPAGPMYICKYNERGVGVKKVYTKDSKPSIVTLLTIS